MLKTLLGDAWLETLDNYLTVSEVAFKAKEPNIYSNYQTKYLKSQYQTGTDDQLIDKLLEMNA